MATGAIILGIISICCCWMGYGVLFGVILGCMAKEDFTKSVQEYCEESRVDLYKMERDPKIYRLVKVPVLQFDD